ncbi:MAG: AAA family ATPase [Solirubrobacteraceae bacterium]|nr:AAA family ATPase [Solirubrobacteraceae bacterium]
MGGLTLQLDGELRAAPRAAGARELLAWLALHSGPHPRNELAARFWPDVLDESARQSLRNALWHLRRDLAPDDGAIIVTREALELAATVEVDVRRLDAALARGEAGAAAALAERGELLRGFDQEWAIVARDDRRERLGALLAQRAEAAGEARDAVIWARRRARLDPLSEDALRDLMRHLAAAGDAAAALAAYDRFAARLQRELRVAPSTPTRALAAELRTVSTPDPSLAEPHAAPTPALDRTGAHAAPAADAVPTGAAPRTTPDVLPRPLPLTGRGTEFGALLGEWLAATAGEGGVVILEGDPGAGKTRLAAELAARAQADGARVALGIALELEGAAPLAPWAEMLDGLLDPPPDAAWVADLARLVPRLGETPGVTGDALDRVRLHEAAVAALAHVASGGPLLLVLEDAHAADAATLALTAHVGRRLRGRPALLVLTRRPAAQHGALDAIEAHLAAAGALRARVTLAPLRNLDAAQLVRAVAPLDEDGVRRAIAAADGNALLVVECARAVAAGHDGPPPSLRTLVRTLLAALSSDARAVAELVAVAGRALEPAELEALPIGDAAAAACEAMAAGLLAEGDAVGYRHALLRDAAYGAVQPPRRRVLHGSLAEALLVAGQAPPAEIARHLRRAGRDDEAVTHLADAARAARDVAALTESRAFVREALAVRPEHAELWFLLAHVDALRGQHLEARSASDRGLELLAPGDHRARGLALLDRGVWMSSVLCWPSDALADFHEAVGLLEGELGLDAERAHLAAASAWAEAVAGDPDRVDALLAEADALSPPGRSGIVDLHKLTARVNALLRQDRPHDALGHAGELESIVDRGGWSHRLGEKVWLEFSSIAAFVGEFTQALAFADRYLAVSGVLHSRRIEGLAARAYLLVRLARPDEAVAAAEEMVALADELGDDELPALARHDLGMVLCEIGEHERGVELIAGALEAGVKAPVSHARLRRAESLVALARLVEARRELRATVLAPLTPADQPETLVPRVARVQALLAHADGERDRTAALYDEAADGWRQLGALDQREAYLSNLVDLGRPPLAGLTEPARELARVQSEQRELLDAQLH